MRFIPRIWISIFPGTFVVTWSDGHVVISQLTDSLSMNILSYWFHQEVYVYDKVSLWKMRWPINSISCCILERIRGALCNLSCRNTIQSPTAKTPLLHMLYCMNWLTHDFWTRTGGWEFDRSHGAGTSSPSHWQQVEEQAPKPVGCMMCFLLMTFVPSRSSV